MLPLAFFQKHLLEKSTFGLAGISGKKHPVIMHCLLYSCYGAIIARFPGNIAVALYFEIIHFIKAVFIIFTFYKINWAMSKLRIINISHYNIQICVFSVMVIVDLTTFYKIILLSESRHIAGFNIYYFSIFIFPL